jgi:hypothetical protein
LLFLISLPLFISGQKLKERTSSFERIRIDYNGKEVKAYEVAVKSKFAHSLDKFFEQEMNPANTLIITKPMAYIRMLNGLDHESWQEGFTYQLKIKTYGFIPTGGIHYIYLEEVNEEKTFIQTREHNNMAKVWDHRLSFEAVGEDSTTYEDRIVIYAGGMSWIFAKYLLVFYKMRHRKWNKLLNSL